jgi:hypothetical protein
VRVRIQEAGTAEAALPLSRLQGRAADGAAVLNQLM